MDTKIFEAGKKYDFVDFDMVYYEHEGLVCVKKNWKYGFAKIDKIDNKLIIEIPLMFDLAFPFDRGVANVMTQNNSFFIDKKGKTAHDPYRYKAGKAA